MVRPPIGPNGPEWAGAERLKSGKGRTASERAWLERQLADPFAAKARALGYRSRAAFKLTEIDDRFRLISPRSRIIDLGCAPGGWLQVAHERGAGALIGVDLLAVEPLAGATLLQGDFTEPGCGERLLAALGGRPDLILSDMAPNTTGHRRTDHLRIVALVEAAAEFASEALQPGGAFLAKAFQGGETAEVVSRLKTRFASVRHLKPKASRAESSELYLLAQGLRG
ncbi:MAG TPA: RlmE family RNA methyltransferase [Caulobacteraceae bacterium]|nr:RlmE family RNA methyltransferase [Caulobacteraceae bacterium]